LDNSGRAADAERCYRRALARPWLSASKRAELLRCLGGVLMGLGRYEESRKCLDEALAMGDPMGGCRASIAELLLLEGIDAERALEMVDQAIEASTTGLGESTSKERVSRDLASIIRASLLGLRAWALALAGRQDEAQKAIVEALQLTIKPSADLLRNYYGFALLTRMSRANTCWLAGMAFLAMKKPDKASECFKKGSDVDPKGKYGTLCRKQLALVG
jgi:tetratricopeptide (TPR) repeat protein